METFHGLRSSFRDRTNGKPFFRTSFCPVDIISCAVFAFTLLLAVTTYYLTLTIVLMFQGRFFQCFVVIHTGKGKVNNVSFYVAITSVVRFYFSNQTFHFISFFKSVYFCSSVCCSALPILSFINENLEGKLSKKVRSFSLQ